MCEYEAHAIYLYYISTRDFNNHEEWKVVGTTEKNTTSFMVENLQGGVMYKGERRLLNLTLKYSYFLYFCANYFCRVAYLFPVFQKTGQLPLLALGVRMLSKRF